MASLLSLALHSKLEYLTDILRTLLGDLAAHYVHRNPKLMLRRLALTWVWGEGQGLISDPFPIYAEWDLALRSGAKNSRSGVRENCRIILTRALGPPSHRTETMVEKLLTNWLSICLYDFLKVRALSSMPPQHLETSACLWSP